MEHKFLEVPGEVTRISLETAHCLFNSLLRIKAFVDEQEEEGVRLWYRIIAQADQDYHLAVDEVGEVVDPERGFAASDVQGVKILSLTEWDRGFLEALAWNELARLMSHPSDEEIACEHPCAPGQTVTCTHTFGDHDTILRKWIAREIIYPKHFVVTRRKVAELSPQERSSGLPLLAREDAERMVEEDVASVRRPVEKDDAERLAEYDENPPYEEYSREEVQETFRRQHEVFYENLRKRSWAILKQKHRII